MRAVKSILQAAGNLKRTLSSNTPESVIILKAIQDCNIPKFVSEDIPLFKGIIADLFPRTAKDTNNFVKLQKEIIKQLIEKKLVINDEFIEKTI